MERNKYLDLDNPEEKSKYEEYYNNPLNILSENGKSIIFKSSYQAMYWGLNLYKKDKEYDLIKYTFPNNRTRNRMKYKNIKYGYNYNEAQLCISRNKIIVKKELCS